MNNRRGGAVVADRYISPPPPGTAVDGPTSNISTQRRRTTSAGKLSQIFLGGLSNERMNGSSLHTGLQDLAMTSKLAIKMAETQRRGVDVIAQWAHNAQNAAIDDVMQQTSQLFHLFAEKQLQFARDYEHFLQQLQKINDADKTIKEAEREVATLDQKERKLKKDIRKGVSFFRQRRGGDICLLRQQLEEVTAAKEVAERTLSDTRAEMEVVKMFRFRHGMQGIADAYRALATSCNAIFTCHREITEMVPAISNQDVRRMVYDGMPITRDRVEELRRSLETGMSTHPSVHPSSRRRSEPIRTRVQASHFGTPPPPYSPTAPVEHAMPLQPVQRNHVSDSQLMHHQGYISSTGPTVASHPPTPQTSSQTPQTTSNCRADWHRRSMPCTGCGHIYPDLPPNPYVMIKQQSQTQNHRNAHNV
uniref:Uncharacterized protein n=1 Tax=Parascaris univalens TaxID=6257 RepID=A0A915ASL3_PARUN